jgi:hypothetical protein
MAGKISGQKMIEKKPKKIYTGSNLSENSLLPEAEF